MRSREINHAGIARDDPDEGPALTLERAEFEGCLRLRVQKTDTGTWKVEGRAWASGQQEPQAWAVSVEEKQKPPAGRASVWAIPFSGKPIRFDDLAASPLP